MKKFEEFELLISEQKILMSDVDSIERWVMCDWEKPLMEKQANIVCQNGGDILEIGFGMGLSANAIQKNIINSHTIVEIHPQIISILKDWAKDKPNVKIIEGNWFDLQEEICKNKYDGIFFDTHEDPNSSKFKSLIVDKCIKENGIFSYFHKDFSNQENFYNIPNLKFGEVDLGEYGVWNFPYVVFSK